MNFDFYFNFENKTCEFDIFNNCQKKLFDKKVKMLPVRMDENGREIQTFYVGEEPMYVLDFNGNSRYINGIYFQDVNVYKIVEFDYFSRKFSTLELLTEDGHKFKTLFNTFMKCEILNRKEDKKFEFIPNEIPTFDDFVTSYALAHFNC